MKKKLALFMTMMLVMSMIPFSAFATEDSENVYVPDGAPEVAQSYANEQIMVVIDLGDYTSLREGYVDLNLKNARLAKTKDPVTYKLTQNDKEITSGTTIKFEDRRQDALSGGESEIVMRVMGKDLENKAKDNIKIFLMFKLDFTDSKIGDVDIEIKDRDQNGVGNHVETIAHQMGDMQREMKLTVSNADSRIGTYGGTLSAFMLENLDRLDSIKSNNEVIIKLPDKFKFEKSTTVEVDGKDVTPTYDNNMRQITITGVNSNNKSITVVPTVKIEGIAANYGNVEINVDFRVKNRIVDSKAAVIGKVTDSEIEMLIKESGKKDIPQMQSSETKTVDIALTGLKESFKDGSYVYFDAEGVEIPYSSVTVISPKGKVLLLGETSGKTNRDLVNGKEVYKEGKFSFKILDPNVSKIEFKMDITANASSDGKAIIEVSSNNFNTIKRNLANIKSKFNIETELTAGQKGVSFKTRDIKIKESQTGMLNTGDKIYLSLDNSQLGFDISDVKISTTAEMQISLAKKNTDGVIELEVLRKSYSSPSNITISGVKVFSLETAVIGDANLIIKINKEEVYDKEYVKIVGLEEIKNTTVFTIGSSVYTVSGVKKESVEAPYIKSGYTMLPVKALAEGLGLSSSWNNNTKTATFTNKNKVAVVTVGESNMIVNGTPIKLSVPAEIKNGATMIELRSLANGFNVNISWDQNLKSATVTSN